MQQSALVFNVAQIKKKLDFMWGSIIEIDEFAEVEDESEEMLHLVGKDVVANVLSLLVLFVEKADPNFNVLLIFCDEHSKGVIEFQIFLEGCIGIEFDYLGSGEFHNLLYKV